MNDFAEARGRQAVAASILAVALLGAYFAASPGGLGAFPTAYLVGRARGVVAVPTGSVLAWVVAWWFYWPLVRPAWSR